MPSFNVRTATIVTNSSQSLVLFTDAFDRGHFRLDRNQVALAVSWNPFSYHQLLNASHWSVRWLHFHRTILGGVHGVVASFVLVLLSASEISIFIMPQFHSFIEMISGRH